MCNDCFLVVESVMIEPEVKWPVQFGWKLKVIHKDLVGYIVLNVGETSESTWNEFFEEVTLNCQ